MRKIFLTLLTIAFCTAAYSQTVETIRKDYNAAKAYVQEMEGPDSPAQNRVRISTEEMYCGTGQHKETVTIYFRQDEENEEPCNKNCWNNSICTYQFTRFSRYCILQRTC